MGGSYVAMRLALDDESNRYKKDVKKGVKKDVKPNSSIQWARVRPKGKTNPPLESKDNRGSNEDLDDTAVEKWRKVYKRQFKNVIIDIDEYHGINQGNEGACSFVAFLNMIHVSGMDDLYKKKWNSIYPYGWASMWGKLNICAAEDIADMLDRVNNAKILGDFSNLLVYFPIRSRGNGENYFNFEIVGEATVKKTALEATAEKIQAKIEGLIARRIPVEINFAEHSRVAVGYNDTHLLFADSWGDKYSEQSADKRDTNAAGFSTVEKNVVYTYAREIAYFEPHHGDAGKVEMKPLKSGFSKLRF